MIIETKQRKDLIDGLYQLRVGVSGASVGPTGVGEVVAETSSLSDVLSQLCRVLFVRHPDLHILQRGIVFLRAAEIYYSKRCVPHCYQPSTSQIQATMPWPLLCNPREAECLVDRGIGLPVARMRVGSVL